MRTNSRLYPNESCHHHHSNFRFVFLLLGATSLFFTRARRSQDGPVFLSGLFVFGYRVSCSYDIFYSDDKGLFGRVGNTPYRLSRFNLL